MRTDESTLDVPEVPGAARGVSDWPIKTDGIEKIWGLTPATLQASLDRGYVRVTQETAHQRYTISFLTTPNVKLAEAGRELKVKGTRPDGSKIVPILSGGQGRATKYGLARASP